MKNSIIHIVMFAKGDHYKAEDILVIDQEIAAVFDEHKKALDYIDAQKEPIKYHVERYILNQAVLMWDTKVYNPNEQR